MSKTNSKTKKPVRRSPKRGGCSCASACYAISKTGSVWMLDSEACCSAERAIAVDAMIAMGLDPNDWRMRDKLIQAISPCVTGMLDCAHNKV